MESKPNLELAKKLNIAAIVVSVVVLFIVGFMRQVKLDSGIDFTSHIVLAAVILPFILFTYIRGFTWQIEKHRKMAKIVFPLWFYVAVTGPIIYFMLKDCY